MRFAIALVVVGATLWSFALLLRGQERERQRQRRRDFAFRLLEQHPEYQQLKFDLGEVARDIANLQLLTRDQLMEAWDVLQPVPTRDYEELT